MKNIVFIPNIKVTEGNTFFSKDNTDGSRSNAYEYSIKSWKHFCDKHNCELIVWEDLLYPIDYMKITFQRYFLFDILEANNIEYDQILMTDADTIVHPDCPNFFEITNNEYCGVMNNGCYEWVCRSIRDFSKLMFDGETINPWEYINGGFQIVNKKHKPFFSFVQEYYKENRQKILDSIEKTRTATDQTIINYLLKDQNIKLNMLPVCYNLQDPFRKNLLHFPNHSYWEDSITNLAMSGWVYHFNAIPGHPSNRDANYWIERTYNELYKK